MSYSNVLEAVSGDTGGSYTLQLVDEDTGTPYDLSPSTTSVVLAVELAYPEPRGRVLVEVEMPKVTSGTDGLVRLGWTTRPLVGAVPGSYTAEVWIYEGSAMRSAATRYTVWDTLDLVVRAPGDGAWQAS